MAEAPTEIKTEKPPKLEPTSVIFDPTLEPARNEVFKIFANFFGGSRAPTPSPSTLMLARMPVKLKDGPGYGAAEDPFMLRPGANIGVKPSDIAALEKTTAPPIVMYRKKGCFRYLSPEIPGTAGDRFRHYSESDAIELISACLSIGTLESGIEGEDRYAVKDVYNSVHSALKEELASRAERE
jgi:hypothetical protein